ncbi:hypothetical protein LMZ02_16330 [Paenibacillus macerans]|uniref:hypothetical protein n=1 Tax=Paenibacillus macerans TaxID=44252 RepID=UPI0012D93C1D|nr:hypothetical protein [Paenibacillus macerans]UMV45111.1 hypothetical protein LMZ02_16330 [Paenibacillus macerans]
MLGPRQDGKVIVIGSGRLLAILSAESNGEIESSLREACEQYIASCRHLAQVKNYELIQEMKYAGFS